MNGLGLLAQRHMLHYNIRMNDHRAHHHHDHGHQHRHPGQAHPPVLVHTSILRLSALHRLGVAAALIALLWAAAFWALR